MDDRSLETFEKLITSLADKLSVAISDGNTKLAGKLEALRKLEEDIKKLHAESLKRDNSESILEELVERNKKDNNTQNTSTNNSSQQAGLISKIGNEFGNKIKEAMKFSDLKSAADGKQDALNIDRRSVEKSGNTLGRVFDGLVGGINKLSSGIGNITEAIARSDGSFKQMLGTLQITNAGLVAWATNIDMQTNAYRDIMTSAEGTITSFEQMNNLSAQAGLHVNQFAEALKKGTPGLRMIGGIQLSQSMRQVKDGLEKFGMLGMSTEQITEAMGSYMEMQRLQGNINDMDFKSMDKKIAEMLEQDRKMADMMGITTEEAKQRRESSRADANFNMLMAEIGPQLADSVGQVADKFSGPMNSLMKQMIGMASGKGVLNADAAKLAMLQGPEIFDRMMTLAKMSLTGNVDSKEQDRLMREIQEKSKERSKLLGAQTFAQVNSGGDSSFQQFAESTYGREGLATMRNRATQEGSGTAGVTTESPKLADQAKQNMDLLNAQKASMDANTAVARVINNTMLELNKTLGVANKINGLNSTIASGANGVADSSAMMQMLAYGGSAVVIAGVTSTVVGALLGVGAIGMAKGLLGKVSGMLGGKTPVAAQPTNLGDLNPSSAGVADAATGSKMAAAKNAAKSAMKGAGWLGAGLLAFDAYGSYSDASKNAQNQYDAGLITDKQRREQSGNAIGKTVGEGASGLGGAAAGAAAGAALGSIVPVLGTAIGGVLGGIVGGLSGNLIGEATGANSWLGQKMGELTGGIAGIFGTDERKSSAQPAQNASNQNPTPAPATTVQTLTTNNFDYVGLSYLFGSEMLKSLNTFDVNRLSVITQPLLNSFTEFNRERSQSGMSLREAQASITANISQPRSLSAFSPRYSTETLRNDNRNEMAQDDFMANQLSVSRDQQALMQELLNTSREQRVIMERNNILIADLLKQIESNTRMASDGINNNSITFS